MTYLDFYKLREDPFAAVYDRARYFPTAASAAVIQSLTDGITQRKGVMLLTGRIGIGKTFTINQLCSQLPPEWVTFHVLSSPQSGDQLLQQLASYVGLPHGSEQLADLAARLQKQIAHLNERGRRTVLIFEESESLSPEVIARIHWLAEMETFERKLVQIILVARPGFRNQFIAPVWEPIRNRIAMSCEMSPMSGHEAAGYIDHRIRGAAGLGCVLEFASEAKADIAHASGGLPRMINAIARDCLLQGFESRVQYIERDIVKQVLGTGGLRETAAVPVPAPAAAAPTPIVETPPPPPPAALSPAEEKPAMAPPEDIPEFDPAASIMTSQSPMLLCAARFDEFKEVPLAVHPELSPIEVTVETPAPATEPSTEPVAQTPTASLEEAPTEQDQSQSPEQAVTDEPTEFTASEAELNTQTMVIETDSVETPADTAVMESPPALMETPVQTAIAETHVEPAPVAEISIETPAESASIADIAAETQPETSFEQVTLETPATEESQTFNAVEALAESSDIQEPQALATAPSINSFLPNEPLEPVQAEQVPVTEVPVVNVPVEPTEAIEAIETAEPVIAADSPESATLSDATQEFLNAPSTTAPQFEETFLQPDGTPWPTEPATSVADELAMAAEETAMIAEVVDADGGERLDREEASLDQTAPADESAAPNWDQPLANEGSEQPAAFEEVAAPMGEESAMAAEETAPTAEVVDADGDGRLDSEEASLDQTASAVESAAPSLDQPLTNEGSEQLTAFEEVAAPMGEESAMAAEEPPLPTDEAALAPEAPAPVEETPAPAQEEPAQQQVLQTASAPVEQPIPTVPPPVIPERIEPARKHDRFAQPREVHLPSEEYRALRTSLLAACEGRFCFAVTSARPKEGKTATCMNLGLMMTERQNTRTVLVDANLRNHKLTNLMNGHSGPGLAEYLRGEATIREILQPSEYDNLFLIGAGNLDDIEVGELLNRPALTGLMETLKTNFDHVIVDAPSVHRTTDATILGEAVGSALMVVRMYDTNREAVQMAIRQLRINKVAVSGVVLTNRKFFIPSVLYRHI